MLTLDELFLNCQIENHTGEEEQLAEFETALTLREKPQQQQKTIETNNSYEILTHLKDNPKPILLRDDIVYEPDKRNSERNWTSLQN